MRIGYIFIGILVVIALLILITCLKIVPQSQSYVMEFLGKYSGTWKEGLHFKKPFVERIAKRVSLKEQVLDFPPQPVITKDNVTMQIDSVVFCKVFDPRLYTYGVENPLMGLQNLAATTLRNIIGDMELDQTLTSRDEINRRMEQILDEATNAWGIKVTRVELKNIKPPMEIEEVMSKQMRAERERRQTVLEAQAHKEAVVSRAEGDKRAKILNAEAEKESQIAPAEGRARSIQLVYEAEAIGLRKIKEVNIDTNVLRLKGLEALKDVSDGRATKIFMPTDLSGVIATLGVAAESLGIGDATQVDHSPKPEHDDKEDPCCDDKSEATQELIDTAEEIGYKTRDNYDRVGRI